MQSWRRWILVGVFTLGMAYADVRVPAIFSGDMVFQRQKPVKVWGTAEPDENVTVTFGDAKQETVAKGGFWQVTLPAMEASTGGTLTIEGATNKLEFRNVAVGEVWLCSGQSNMQWPIIASADPQKEIAEANYPNIRLFTVERLAIDIPQTNCKGEWQVCMPKNASNFSAVAYSFGRALHQKLNCPIGLISTNYGGTPAEAWTSRRGFEQTPEIKGMLERWDESEGRVPANKAADKKAADKKAAKKAQNRSFGPKGISPNAPTGLYNAMIQPLVPFSIRGAIWYQGESNAGSPDTCKLYQSLFPAMIKSWRQAFGQGDFPFLFVQLAPFETKATWPEMREAQLITTEKVPNTAMAVITDVGEPNDIHPKQKRPVGERLAVAARKLAYNEDVIFSGPIYESMNVEGNTIILSFKHVGGGLVCKGDKLTGFTIAGADGKFHDADAVIKGNTVAVSCPAVTEPKAARFGWSNFPIVNLWNKEDLPASPFRTDRP